MITLVAEKRVNEIVKLKLVFTGGSLLISHRSAQILGENSGETPETFFFVLYFTEKKRQQSSPLLREHT